MPDDEWSAEQEDGGARANAYRGKPPLWRRPDARPSLWTVVGSVALSALALGLVGVLLDGRVFVVPVGQVEVTVVRMQSAKGGEETPPAFLYVVRLPDGSLRTFSCGRFHRSGDRLLVTVNRGALTGWLRLSPPYRVVAPAPDPVARPTPSI